MIPPQVGKHSRPEPSRLPFLFCWCNKQENRATKHDPLWTRMIKIFQEKWTFSYPTWKLRSEKKKMRPPWATLFSSFLNREGEKCIMEKAVREMIPVEGCYYSQHHGSPFMDLLLFYAGLDTFILLYFNGMRPTWSECGRFKSAKAESAAGRHGSGFGLEGMVMPRWNDISCLFVALVLHACDFHDQMTGVSPTNWVNFVGTLKNRGTNVALMIGVVTILLVVCFRLVIDYGYSHVIPL